MYQPRRAAGPIEPMPVVQPAPPSPFVVAGAPRRALPTAGEHWFSRGSLALAVVATAATAGAVVLSNSGLPAAALAAAVPTERPVAAAAAADRAVPMAKLVANEIDTPAVLGAARKADASLLSLTKLYPSGSLNVRATPDGDAELLGKVSPATRVLATSEIDGDYRRIEFEDGYGWVLAKSLGDTSPDGFIDDGTAAAGTTMAACSRGSAVERKLRADTIHIYRSVCALFADVNSYGGWRAGGLPFHKNGRALDIMLTPGAESALGHRIAAYLIEHARDFNVDHIIFEQRIWTPSTPHWRHMADRGGTTANHFDHVHVAIRA